MAPTTATDDSTEVEIEILYVRGSESRSADRIDEDDELFQLTRDLSGFGADAFDEWGHDVEHALETAYVELGSFETVVDDVDELLGDVYERLQGPRTDDEIGYDGAEWRSMTVGDVIVVDGTPYMVDRFGFAELELEEDDGDDDSDDGDEWDPEPAQLRDGETVDGDSHAARNAAMLRQAREELDRETDGDRDCGADTAPAATDDETELHVPDDDCVVITDGGEDLEGERVIETSRMLGTQLAIAQRPD